jgi:hypothetical protein
LNLRPGIFQMLRDGLLDILRKSFVIQESSTQSTENANVWRRQSHDREAAAKKKKSSVLENLLLQYHGLHPIMLHRLLNRVNCIETEMKGNENHKQ